MDWLASSGTYSNTARRTCKILRKTIRTSWEHDGTSQIFSNEAPKYALEELKDNPFIIVFFPVLVIMNR